MLIKGKLTTYSLLLGLVPLLLAAIAATWMAGNALHDASSDRLSAIRDAKQQQIELYFQQIRDQVITLSDSTMIQDAMVELRDAFFEQGEAHDAYGFSGGGSDWSALEAYYRDAFGAKYQEETGESIAVEGLMPKDTAALRLQTAYIADNRHPLGEKHKLDSADDGSRYAQLHRKYHPAIREFLEKFGYYDIFLVDIESGKIVYSVFKELDFATSLRSGPYKETNFAEAFRTAAQADSPQDAALVDFDHYTPSYEAPASFIGSPIFRDGRKVGVLLFQMPIDRITTVLNQRTGMGETGEVYLVGADGLMRSNSRFDENTSILAKRVETDATRSALAGETGVGLVNDYRGVPVLSAYAPVKIDGVNWAILGEIDQAEAFADVGNLIWLIVGLSIAAAAVVALTGVLFARQLSRPIVAASSIAKRITEGSLDNPVEINGKDETADLLRALDTMQQDLKRRIQSEEAAAQNERIKAALDSVATPVLAADAELKVIYRNDAARALLALAAPSLGEPVGQHVDNAIDVVRGAFADEPFERRWQSGEYTMDIVAGPVRNDAGSVQGWVMQLIDRTEELAAAAAEQERIAAERETAAANTRLKVALDNVSSNVTVADDRHEIIYMNAAARQLFTDAQDDIAREISGFDASRIMGANIDMFHKQPSHQRSLVDGLTTTHHAGFEIGGRTMRFVANPVVDAQGKRLGTVVEWTDRTAEVAVEREIDALVEAAGNGDLGQRLTVEDKQGFFRQLATGFNSLLDQLSGVFDDIGVVIGGLAEGDLRRQIEREYRGTFQQVTGNINSTLEHLRDVVGRLSAVSDRVDASVSEIASGNGNLSARTEQQASSLEETASSMEQLTSTVRNNADSAQQANQVASNARQLAEKGGKVVSSAIDAMGQIDTASNRIAEIIGVIDEIAFQTNLLALNASVEAARAGEQGRGFAVVATEVRNLASRSAAAAKEIKELIQDSVNKVRAGSALVNESGATLGEIVTGVKKVGDIVAEIAAASAEQAAGIDQVNQAILQMDNMTQQNAALAEETSAASREVSDNAVELKELVGFFRV